jgi:hypothetical protein
MGSVLSGIGNAVGSIFGGIGGGAAKSAGAQSQFHAGNQYDPKYLQQMTDMQGQIYGGQQSLAQALQAQMMGQGPNPAQTQYQMNVGNNIANAQGLIASQRGLNPALAARMGANAASKANQEASLGSALMQQQQQIAATQNLGGLYGQMQQGNLGYQGLYNDANIGVSKLNQATAAGNANTAGQITGGLMNAVGGAAGKAVGAAHGGFIGGNAKVQGDSPQNDTVPAMLSPGEIVIPRSKAADPDKAKEFIDHLLKKEKGSKIEYKDVLSARKKKKSA